MSLTLFVSYPFMPDSPLSTHLSLSLSLSFRPLYGESGSLRVELAALLPLSLSLRSSHLLFFPSIHPKGIHLCVIFLANRFRQSH